MRWLYFVMRGEVYIPHRCLLGLLLTHLPPEFLVESASLIWVAVRTVVCDNVCYQNGVDTKTHYESYAGENQMSITSDICLLGNTLRVH